MKSIFLSFFLISFYLVCNGQSEYLITVDRDTIYGDVQISLSGLISVKTSAGKQEYYASKVLEYKDQRSIYQVLKFKSKEGKAEYISKLVKVDGKLRVLLHCSKCNTYYFSLNSNYYYISKKTFLTEVFPLLNQCELFKKEFEIYTDKEILKMIGGYNRIKKIAETYNLNCN